MDFCFNSICMKGIYLHGYQGYVTEEKKEFLNNYGDIYAPNINYDENPSIILNLLNDFKEDKFDFVSGTSLGGLFAYHMALKLDIPCLLLNPAVTAVEIIKDFLPENTVGKSPNNTVNVIVGMKDEIIAPSIQLDFFNRLNDPKELINIKKYEDLGHFVPLDIFEESFNQFRIKLMK